MQSVCAVFCGRSRRDATIGDRRLIAITLRPRGWAAKVGMQNNILIGVVGLAAFWIAVTIGYLIDEIEARITNRQETPPRMPLLAQKLAGSKLRPFVAPLMLTFLLLVCVAVAPVFLIDRLRRQYWRRRS